MKTRRGSSLWGTPLGGASMVNQYKPGDVVHSAIVSGQAFFTGIVRDVCTKTNKVTVAWGGGSLSQHDPDELMPAMTAGLRMASRRVVKDKTATIEGWVIHDILIQAQLNAERLVRSDHADVKALAMDYAERKTINDGVDSSQEQEIADKYYVQSMKAIAEEATRRAGRGMRSASEKEAGDPNTDPQFVGDPETHGVNEPRGGGFSIMQQLQDDLHKESIEQAKGGAKVSFHRVVTFYSKDGDQAIGNFRQFHEAMDLWKKGFPFEVNGKKYRAGDEKGREEIENLFGESFQMAAGLRSRRAMYWSAPNRVYRLTRKEVADNTATCPNCGQAMNTDKFTRSEKLFMCPECGFKIPTGSVVRNVSEMLSRRKANKVAIDKSELDMNPDQAKEVLNALGNISGAKAKHYENGREHGFFIEKGDKAVAFSEYRNSDDIVVYYGGNADFDEDHIPTDDTYRRKKFFKYQEYEAAAKFIKAWLR